MSAELTLIAIQAALSAGALVRKGFHSDFLIESKPGKQNLVTEYDHASEECILSLISDHFPNHSILSEECGEKRHDQHAVLWIIDPLDGTVNFAHGVPLFSISIGIAIEGKIVSGVIYQPMTQELFVAEAGKGAYLNGSAIHVSSITHLENALLATGFPYNIDENPLHCIDRFAEMLAKGVPIRRLGSAAIDLAYVAAGRFDAYWEVSLNPWDMAAGKLLVEEAGGRVTHYDGSLHKIFCHDTLVASNGALHNAMLAHLKKI